MDSKKSANIEPLYLKSSSEQTTSGGNVQTTEQTLSATTTCTTTEQTESNHRLIIDVQCLLCDRQFKFYAGKDDYLAHLFLVHRLVIADEEQVAIFDEYLQFWRNKFNGDSSKLPEYCTTMHLDHLPDGTPSPQEKYYLLADILPEDNELRQKLQAKRLEKALTQHQFERMDTTFERGCLYCRDIVKSTRNDYLKHLFTKHFLQLGKSENLVYVDELLDLVQEKMAKLICLFCEKKFKDRPTLKEHMRKKGHKRINPDIKNYDKFFLVNYKNEKQISYGQRTKHAKKPNGPSKASAKQPMQQSMAPKTHHSTHAPRAKSPEQSDHSDRDWSDWEGESQVLTCLYCPLNATDFGLLKAHIKTDHCVDFDRLTGQFSFYDRVKCVNFVRRQMHAMKCLTCSEQFTTTGDLQKHLQQQQHYGIGERKQWDLAEYFFPTYEDDAFLCHLDDNYASDEDVNVAGGSDAVGRGKHHSDDDDEDDDWSDWEGDRQALTCLYCPLNDLDFTNLKIHIKDVHNVNFDELTESFSFYDRVKIVNFVRRQMHSMKCLTCAEQFTTADDLQKHLQQQQHYGIGERRQWDLAEYFFPTYEDDAFLCSLDDTNDGEDDDSTAAKATDASVVVHSEDTEIRRNPDAEALSKEQTLAADK